ncbi:MAG: LCP family protein [Erysipelotrichaceae bacterium]
MNHYIKLIKSSKLLIAAIVLSFIIVLTGIYNIFQFQSYFPMRYTILVSLAIVLFCALSFLLIFKGPKVALIYNIIIAILFSLVSVGAGRLASFSDHILNNGESELMQIVVLKKSNINKEDDFSKLKIGYVKPDTYGTKFAKDVMIDEDKTNVKSKNYKTYEDLYQALIDKEVDLMPISSYGQSRLKEKSIDYQKTTRVLFEKRRDLKAVAGGNKDLTSDPFVMFVSGVDLTSGDITSTGSSDVNILMAVNPKTKKIMMQSIPRDLWSKIPCNDNLHTKLTYAGATGGVNCSIEAIQNYFDVKIDYFAKINFDGVRDLVDAMGGISVYSDATYCEGSYCFVEGENQLDGENALMFSRIRHVLAKGDVARGIHQMEVIRGVINKFLENPSMDYLNSLMGAVESNFTTNLERNDLVEALQLLLSMQDAITNMESYSINGEFKWNTDEVNGEYLYYYYPSEGETKAVHNRINNIIKGK